MNRVNERKSLAWLIMAVAIGGIVAVFLYLLFPPPSDPGQLKAMGVISGLIGGGFFGVFVAHKKNTSFQIAVVVTLISAVVGAVVGWLWAVVIIFLSSP